MASTIRGEHGAFYEGAHGHTPRARLVRPAQGIPFIPPINLSIPPPPFPFTRGTNPPITLPPPNLMLSGPPPIYPIGKETTPPTTGSLVPPTPPPPILLIPYNGKYVMKFNNVELLPQYLIENDLRYRFGVTSCLVEIQRDTEVGAPITDDEVEIKFDDLATAQEAFKDLSNEERYSELRFHEACVPPSEAIDAIEVSKSLDHFYCLTFKDEGQVNWDIQQLKEIFSTYGNVASVNKDKLGNIYVRYCEKRSAQLALFYLANDPVIHLKNARNLKEKVTQQNNVSANRGNSKSIIDSQGGSDYSNLGDDAASTASGDAVNLSMSEMKLIENKFLSDLNLVS